jgi:hypothetical protein
MFVYGVDSDCTWAVFSMCLAGGANICIVYKIVHLLLIAVAHFLGVVGIPGWAHSVKASGVSGSIKKPNMS